MIDYTNRKTLYPLCRRMLALSPHQKNAMAAYVVSRGLMYPKGIWDRVLYYAAFLGSKISGISFEQCYYETLNYNEQCSLMGCDIVTHTVQWMINGKDQTDPKSAGGFSKEELALLFEGLVNIEDQN